MSIKRLKNGLRYYVNNNKGSSSVSVYFFVNVGSIDEKEGGYGLAHFLEHMLFKGTKSRLKSKNLTNNIYKIGAETNAFTSFAMTGYYINASYDYLENVLDILSDYNKERNLFSGYREADCADSCCGGKLPGNILCKLGKVGNVCKVGNC